ncbi:MAG: questin oxidase family protein [Massilia sp.]
MPISSACKKLLEQGREHSPLYANRLANHLPMALIALDRMGADAAVMQSFADRYRRRLRTVPDEPGYVDPREYLGSGEHYPEIARFFRRRIEDAGTGEVLREWVPLLLPGLAASAFHSMIRLAYAVDADDQQDIPLALAYWATEYAPIPLSMDTTDATLAAVAAHLSLETSGHIFGPGIIIDKMLEIAQHPALAHAAVLPAQDLTLNDVAQFALSVYVDHEDFTLLHLVTGCHALRQLLPYAGDTQLALRYLWHAVLAAYLTVPRPAPASAAPVDCAIPADLIPGLACAAGDDHVIKLCYSALCEYREYGDERYLHAAGRKLASAGLAPQQSARPG